MKGGTLLKITMQNYQQRYYKKKKQISVYTLNC